VNCAVGRGGLIFSFLQFQKNKIKKEKTTAGRVVGRSGMVALLIKN
jgi:hypothetical protein